MILWYERQYGSVNRRTLQWLHYPRHAATLCISGCHSGRSFQTRASQLNSTLKSHVMCSLRTRLWVVARSDGPLPHLEWSRGLSPGVPHKATTTDVDEESPSRHGGGQCLTPAGGRLLRNGESAALPRIPCTMLKELTVGYTVDHWTWASPTMMTSQFGLMGAVNLCPPLSFNNARHVSTPPSVEPPPVPNSWDPFWGGARSLSCFESVVGEHKHPAKRTRSHRSIEAPPSRSKLLGCCE